MIFAEFRTSEAEGLILAHSLRLPGRMLKKGRVLSADDLAALTEAGVRAVLAAKLEAGDVGEDEAATIVAAALAGGNTARSAAFTGRCNLVATAPGLAVIDHERLDRLNLVDEAVTVATVPPFETVAARQIVATVKVIPFGINRHVADACAAFAASGGPLLSVREFRPTPVGLILTRLPGTKQGVLESTAAVTRARIEGLGSAIAFQTECAHEIGAIQRSVTKALASDCGLVLISGASATVDRRDVVPEGIVRAGGVIDHFGMPVDPGNLLLLAHHGGVPIIDMPGCGRSPRINGLDWVLRRLLAGLPVTGRDIMRMGAGGLLKDIPSRPMPRERAVEGRDAPREPRIGALVLAAGAARRMGSNKLLALVDGKPMVARMTDAALASRADPVVVVTGHEAEAVRAALAGREATFAANPDYAEGLASSLKAGLAALPEDVDGVLVCLGDMPALTADHLDRIIAAFDPAEGRAICLPVHRGHRGNPVLLGRQFFDEMARLDGDMGARRLIDAHAEQVCEVVMEDDAVLLDVDTPDALRALERLP